MVAKVDFGQIQELQAESKKLLSSLENAMRDIAVDRAAEGRFESSPQAELSSPRLGMS